MFLSAQLKQSELSKQLDTSISPKTINAINEFSMAGNQVTGRATSISLAQVSIWGQSETMVCILKKNVFIRLSVP